MKINKKGLVVILIVAIGIVGYVAWSQKSNNENTALPSSTFSQTDTSNWKTYTNKKYGFELEYPPDWETEAVDCHNNCNVETADTVTVGTIVIDSVIATSAWIGKSPKDILLGEAFPSDKILLDHYAGTVGGVASYHIKYQEEEGYPSQSQIHNQIALNHNGIIYRIDYLIDYPEVDTKQMSEIERVISTFKFTK